MAPSGSWSGNQVIQGFFPAGRPRVAPSLPAGAMVSARTNPVRPQVTQLSGQVRGAVSHHGNAFALPSSFRLRPPGAGQRLPGEVQRKMEAVFGADFSDVRVHVGSEASSIGALAFAHGSDLYFAPGHYDPQTLHGQRLLGHELAHVVQQRAGRVRNPFGSGIAVLQDAILEAEAERMGLKVSLTPRTVPVQAKPARPFAPRAILPRLSTLPAKRGIPGGGTVIQRDHNMVRISYEEDGATRETDWAVSDSLEVTIKIGHNRYLLPASSIHTTAMSTSEQQLKAAITCVFRSSTGIKMETIQLSKIYEPHEFHTESALLLDLAKTIAAMLKAGELGELPILGVIIEIRQSNSPCATCQKVMSLFTEKMHNEFNVPVIIRASAMQIYESSHGPIGAELHRQTLPHTAGYSNQGPPDMSEVTGIHRQI